jgi:glycosyltransferase involved in cell wall biosynthesis
VIVIENVKMSIVCPCYNEEEVLPETVRRLLGVIDELVLRGKISKESFVLFVDDGSKDNTWELVESFSKNNMQIKGLKLSRNQGHQNALMAGMEYVVDKCDCLISIDADLQDDVQAIFSMIDKFEGGNEIVYGVRSKRQTDNFFKKFTAEGFYKLMKTLGVDIVFNHADYRLMSQKAVKFFLEFGERNLFIRGIVPLVGLKSDVVYYERNERFAGESKYPIKKMLSFALDGITSFSVTPLRLISILGFLIFLGSIVMSIYIFVIVFFTSKAIPGWASTVLPIYFIGGVQLLSLGVIGEYVGKIYKETKKRPRYFIDKEV